MSAGTTGSGTRDAATNVSAPTITAPGANPYLSNGSSMVLQGGCTTGNLVHLTEILESGTAVPLTTTCAASSYSFTITASSDGLHSYEIQQQAVFQGETLEYVSPVVNFAWFRDATPPAPPVITQPATNPFQSATESVTLEGTCETDATVYLGGDSEQSMTCAESAFSFTVSKGADGSYYFTLRQVDPAGNGASAPNFTWVREFKPNTPVITSPASSPVYSNGSSLNLTGSCTPTYTVMLGGVVAGDVTSPANNLNQACSGAGTFAYTISKNFDGVYTLSVRQKNPSTNQDSEPASVEWRRDATPPLAPTIEGFGANPYYSNGSGITIGGACEPGATVHLTGGSTQSVVCPIGASYSFSVTKSVDASYAFSVKQTDLASNTSPTTSQTWVRDTVAPSAPTRTTPGANPFQSGDSTITISGACENFAVVTLTDIVAATTQEFSCAGSVYSFSVNKALDGTYDFTLLQEDRAQNVSGVTSFQWQRDTEILATPTITSPATDPYTTYVPTLTLTGGCEAGATVTIAGVNDADVTTPASGLSVPCSGALDYTFIIEKAVDGTFNLSVTQTLGPKTSSSATRQWKLDRSAPLAPTMTSPASSPFYSKLDLLTISGACEAGATVQLSGASSQSTTCTAGSTYSFNVSKTTDATYSFSVSQSDAAGNASASVTKQWIRDTAAPGVPTVAAPAGNPYVSSGDLTISGSCETGTTVTLGGDVVAGNVLVPNGSLTRTCVASAYTYTVTKGVDGTYNLTVNQRDTAGNTSANATLQWIKESTIPAPPVITAPASSPFYSNLGTLTISGTCNAGYLVNLGGDDTQAPYTCTAGGAFTFTVTKGADATYSFYISQENATTGTISSEASVQWVRDTSVPAAPTRLTPASSPYTSAGDLLIQGNCEAGATVNLTGGAVQSTSCTALGSYQFTVPSLPDGSYDFLIAVRDQAGNTSPTTGLTWVSNSSMPPTPVISSPSLNPYEYNGNSIVLAGDCVTGNQVTLSGNILAADVLDPPGSLTQTCAASTFSFTIRKIMDGNFDFTVKQNDGMFDSALATQRWIRDAAAPVISLTGSPGNPNLSIFSQFSFAASEPVAFECSIDGGAFGACLSPLSYFELPNGAHTFEVRGTDVAGNLGNTVSYSWTQAANRTVALYHLDSSGPTIDSGLYAGAGNNALTVSTGNVATTGVFAEGRQFSGAGVLSAPDSPTLNTIGRQLTFETRVKVASVPNSGYNVIAGQTASAAGGAGWEVRLRKGKGGGKFSFSFFVSTGPSTGTEVRSSSIAYNTATFYHLAVVYDHGAAKIYLDGKLIGSGTTSAQSLNNSTTLFRIGEAEGSTDGLNGVIDEVRVSQMNRYPAPFTSPSSAFTAD
ncbi:MAG: hypothetical protein NDJ90_04925 [Oligoflexia bacterium]|nr:hypothetical protein [Oligoflexia bacterium]